MANQEHVQAFGLTRSDSHDQAFGEALRFRHQFRTANILPFECFRFVLELPHISSLSSSLKKIFKLIVVIIEAVEMCITISQALITLYTTRVFAHLTTYPDSGLYVESSTTLHRITYYPPGVPIQTGSLHTITPVCPQFVGGKLLFTTMLSRYPKQLYNIKKPRFGA